MLSNRICFTTTKLVALLITVFFLVHPLNSKAARSRIPALRELNPRMAKLHPDLVQERAKLERQRHKLHNEVKEFNAHCVPLDQNAPNAASCVKWHSKLLGQMGDHIDQSNAFNDKLKHAMTSWYRPSGNALIGGTGWIVGYNVQSTDPRIVKQARAMLKKQSQLAGTHYGEDVDFKRYNFILGIAASTNEYKDLADRVLFDQLSNGKASAKGLQNAYNSLKGRSFGELGCHSNGAMVCLAALENGDVLAQRVVLYGPQITAESLRMWNNLVKIGKVHLIELLINHGDPVPRFSFLFGNPHKATTVPHESMSFETALHKLAPNIAVKVYPCSQLPSLSCHAMKVYKKNRG